MSLSLARRLAWPLLLVAVGAAAQDGLRTGEQFLAGAGSWGRDAVPFDYEDDGFPDVAWTSEARGTVHVQVNDGTIDAGTHQASFANRAEHVLVAALTATDHRGHNHDRQEAEEDPTGQAADRLELSRQRRRDAAHV